MKQNYEEMYRKLSKDFFTILELCRENGLTFTFDFKSKKYKILSNNNKELRDNFYELTNKYNNLIVDFEELSDDYFTLKAEYEELKGKYILLSRCIRL